MLVLGRKAHQTIIINDNIKVTILEINGQQVKLGIEAPKKIEVHRQEIYDLIQQQKNTVT